MRHLICVLVALLASLAVRAQPEAFPSTYVAPAGQPVLFKNATILTGDGRRLDETDLYVAEGRIQWVGEGKSPQVPPKSMPVVSGFGLIDVHSHLGVYPSPGVAAHSDGNEGHRACDCAEVWAEHSVSAARPASRERWPAIINSYAKFSRLRCPV
ncbi:MAG: hypothetical protein CM15mP125_3840 [Gammaproteobacteria bacterium]|nr:MAG: hypothetical protein CM15mP125_3840 [Gammaproteobacteria bacterium]